MITLTIPGEPVAQGRPKFFTLPNGRTVATDPKKSRQWKGAAQIHIQEALRGARRGAPAYPEGPVHLHVVAVFTRPASIPKKAGPGRQPHAKRGDADNVAKAVMDAAEGLLYTRDAQVARLTVEKWVGAQGEAPSLEVRIGLPWEDLAERRTDDLEVVNRGAFPPGPTIDAC